jgi:hypothetical protein
MTTVQRAVLATVAIAVGAASRNRAVEWRSPPKPVPRGFAAPVGPFSTGWASVEG